MSNSSDYDARPDNFWHGGNINTSIIPLPLPMNPPPPPPIPPGIDSHANSNFTNRPSNQSDGSSWLSGYSQSDEYENYSPCESYSQSSYELNDNDHQLSQSYSYPYRNYKQKMYNGQNWKPFKNAQMKPYVKNSTPYSHQSGGSLDPSSIMASTTVIENDESNSYTVCSPLTGMYKETEERSTSDAVESNLIDNCRPPPCQMDPNIPDAIVAQIRSNACGICNVVLNSRIQAKTHYEGRPHGKKLKTVVQQYKLDNLISETKSNDCNGLATAGIINVGTVAVISNDSTESLPSPAKKRKNCTDGSKLYCKCCDLSFTSNEHATQHYLGRNHQRVLHGLKPLKAGYYNKETGKWQRTPPDPRTPTELISEGDDNNDPDSVKDKGKFFCELCGVSATSQDQLNGHLSGQRHRKTQVIMAKSSNESSDAVAGSQDSILASVIKNDETKKMKAQDLSIYRTPSGKYYCSPCDITLNSECQFAQHMESKKHKHKKK